MKEIIVLKDEGRYILSLVNNAKIKIELEHKVEKRGIETLGFCPSNYSKKVTKKETLSEIRLMDNLKTVNHLKLKQLADDISNLGYIKAINKLDVTPEEKFKAEMKRLRKIEAAGGRSTSFRTKEMLNDAIERKMLSEFVFESRNERKTFLKIIEEIKEIFGITVSKTTLLTLNKEACRRRGVKVPKRGDFWNIYQDKIKEIIKLGYTEKETMKVFKEKYDLELKHYHYWKAKGEMENVKYV